MGPGSGNYAALGGAHSTFNNAYKRSMNSTFKLWGSWSAYR